MRRLVSTVQQRVAAEIARTVSEREAILAAREMRRLANHCRSPKGNFLKLSRQDLEVILTNRGTSDSTNRRCLQIIRRIYDVAVHLRMIRENPAASITRPRYKQTRPDYSVDQSLVDELIAYCWRALRLHDSPLEAFRTLLKLALVYALSSGAFLSELPAVRCDDLLSDGLVVGRGSRKRRLYLSSDAAIALRNYRSVRISTIQGRRDAVLLFVTESGKAIYFKLVWKLLDKVIQKAGVGDLGLTPAKLQRASVKLLADNDLDWLDAFAVHSYRSIPNIKLKPYSSDELAEFVDRLHPMSADRASRQ
ncbi:tyrosine-type recombinase/integrase [Bradyrhizobium diazoefficiens]|uniref:tyrosine-type recombinase/integrase n=1 Tax=Bradyrhizobium diazoefficiens TaxID=1355477 RepID=UPI003492DA79